MMPAEMFECDVGACRMADPLAERRRSGFETLTQGANRLSLAVFAAAYIWLYVRLVSWRRPAWLLLPRTH